MSNSIALSNTMYYILNAMGKDAEFLYDTIDKYVVIKNKGDSK